MRLGIHLFLSAFMTIAIVVPVAFAAPVITPIDDETIVINETLSIPVSAKGARNIKVINMEPWMTFDGNMFTATPGDQDVGGYRIAFVASDGRSRAFERIAITVLSATTPEVPIDDPVPPTSDVPPAAQIVRPVGIYSMSPVDLPYVDGFIIRPRWEEMEPNPGEYDFSSIADSIHQAEELGQSLTLANMVLYTPQWLVDTPGMELYTTKFAGGVLSPVPWDNAMLERLELLIQAQSNYEVDGIPLRDHPVIRHVATSIGGMNSIRFLTDSGELPPGYSQERLSSGVMRSVQGWVDAYPDKSHYVGLFGVTDGISNPSTSELLRDQLLEQFPGMNFFQELLTGVAPRIDAGLGHLLADVSDKTGIMFQACGGWSNKENWVDCTWLSSDSTPDAGFANGVDNYNAAYFEIYTNDLQNPDYEIIFTEWSQRIKALANN